LVSRGSVKMPKIDPNEFERVVKLFVSAMGFDIASSDILPSGSIDIIATSNNPLGGTIKSLIRAESTDQDIDRDELTDLFDTMELKGAVRAAIITTSGFTDDAIEFARGKPISLMTKYQLMEALERRGVKVDPDMMDTFEKYGWIERHYEEEGHSFALGKTPSEALEFFQNRRKKKKIGIFSRGYNESVAKIDKRYAPIGVFKVIMTKQIPLDESSLEKVENREYLFVNLNTAELYYMQQVRRRRSILYVLRSSSILKEIMSLPPEAKSNLLDLLDHGELPEKYIAEKHLAILDKKELIKIYEGRKRRFTGVLNTIWILFDETRELIIMFLNDIVGGITILEGGGEGAVGAGEALSEKNIQAEVIMPHETGGKYDLRHFLVVDDVINAEIDRDKIKYTSTDISTILKSIFGGSVSHKGVIYMPYYKCRYIDTDTNQISRYEILISPEFITESKEAIKNRHMMDEEEVKTDWGIIK